jgi:hypothetical protein
VLYGHGIGILLAVFGCGVGVILSIYNLSWSFQVHQRSRARSVDNVHKIDIP